MIDSDSKFNEKEFDRGFVGVMTPWRSALLISEDEETDEFERDSFDSVIDPVFDSESEIEDHQAS